MYFKRHEAYRYTFDDPINGQLASSEASHETIDVTILDISREGAKLQCQHAVHLRENTTISLSFQLNHTSFWAEGHIVWVKTYPRSADIGVFLNSDDAYKESITQELKQIAKRKKDNE